MSAVDEVWHELVLCGVGGRTITEAKERMTHVEFTQWMDFRIKRGSLFVGNRLESGFALVAWMIHRFAGGEMKVTDFMPHVERYDPDPDSPGIPRLDEVMNILRGVKR